MIRISLAGLVGLTAALFAYPQPKGEDKKPFGGPKDVAFARKVWTRMKNYPDWELHSDVIKGQTPHGKWVKIYSSWIRVDGKLFPILVKDNFRGRGVSPKRIQEDRGKWLKAVTIMLKRKPGYDKENQDWFWAKFSPDGKLVNNPKGVPLAGRVAKGSSKGCISCHSQADGDDYLFSNDG
ncbi:MAG TPA: hypothetical protein ENK02_06170 [Planctomycetes bacterium]|nr:hypothetical protein [Planctomycetota bacterium]